MFKLSFQKRKPRLIDLVKISSPCSVPFAQMTGNERVRFCGDCKKNVYNISSMSESEAESFLRANRGQKLCLMTYQRADGTVMFEKCPKVLKKIRQHTLKTAVTLAMFFGLFCLAQRVQAEGLVGAPVDTRYGTSGEVGGLADYGYDTSRDICSLLTVASIPLSAFFGLIFVGRTRKQALRWYKRGASKRVVKALFQRRVLQSIALVIWTPLLIHYFGTCIVSFLPLQ